MTTHEFRQIRQIELAHFLCKNLGENWRNQIRTLIPGKCSDRRWFRMDSRGNIHNKIEAWCYARGFVSRYDELLEPVAHHAVLVNEVLKKAKCGGTDKDPALPLRKAEIDQLVFAFGLK